MAKKTKDVSSDRNIISARNEATVKELLKQKPAPLGKPVVKGIHEKGRKGEIDHR